MEKTKHSKIMKIEANEILDSRSKPTVEAIVETEKGVFKASVPSGASKGEYEAKELRDEDGGIKGAIRNIKQTISPRLEGEDVLDQKRIDEILIELDGTEDKSRLGANAILAVSFAVCRAGAGARDIPLYQHIHYLFSQISEKRPEAVSTIPKGFFNILNGGVHAENNLDIQEFIIVPQHFSFKEDFKTAEKVYVSLEGVLKQSFGKKGVRQGDEGGFSPPLEKTTQALDFLKEALKKSGFSEKEVFFALDCASSQFFDKEKGKYKIENQYLSGEELLSFYKELLGFYPIFSLEDPFSQDDWGAWKDLLKKLKGGGSELLIVGDDLTVTNLKRIQKARENNACNAVIIKPNQVGTVSETLKAVKEAKEFGWKVIVSHRSGETEDDFIADLAVGVGADFLKAGAPATKVRLAKYNRLIEIEKEVVNHIKSQ